MRILLDSGACQGHGLCGSNAPDLFELSDEDGHARVLVDGVPAGREAAALRAEGNCPERAITVAE